MGARGPARDAAIAVTEAFLPEHADLEVHIYPGLPHSVSERELADLTHFLERALAR